MQIVLRKEKLRLVFLAVAVIAVLASACQSGPPQISIEGAKAELSGAIIGEAMVTMTIRNQGGPDVLTAVKTDLAGVKTTFHVMQGERMVETDSVKIPEKSTVELKMGGSHIMLTDMQKNVTAGAKFKLSLFFQKSGEKKLDLALQPAAAMPMGHEHHM